MAAFAFNACGFLFAFVSGNFRNNVKNRITENINKNTKLERQLKNVCKIPPRTGARAGANKKKIPKLDKILRNCSLSVTSCMIVRAIDINAPTPNPCITRPAIKTHILGESMHTIDPIAKMILPNNMTGLRPNLSELGP